MILRKISVFSVFENVTGSEPVKRCAAHFSVPYGSKAVINGWIKADFCIREIRPDIVVLHPVIFVYRKAVGFVF